MKIKTKLLISIGLTTFLLLTATFLIVINLTTGKINKDLFKQLENQKQNISNQVEDLITTSARGYLSAIGEESGHISQNFYNLYKNKEISYNKAEELTINALTEFKFMESGFIFITDSKGNIIGHPDESKIGTISPVQAWIQRLKNYEKKFKSYYEKDKYKLVYRVYDKKFHFNICVSAYTSDFISAIDMNELSKTMNNLKIGENGYPYIISSDGVILTEPNKKLINQNVLEFVDANNNKIYKTIIDQKKGYFTYKWFNNDGIIKDRFVSYITEKNSKLIIILTGYPNEFFGTVNVIKKIIVISGITLLFLLLLITYLIATTISSPIVKFTNRLEEISKGDGDLTLRIETNSHDEISLMVESFNHLLDVIHDMIASIKRTIESNNDLKDVISYRVSETSASVKKIHSNIISIKNQSKQIKNSPDEIGSYLVNSMDLITKGSNKISNSMEFISENTKDLEINSSKLLNKINRFKI